MLSDLLFRARVLFRSGARGELSDEELNDELQFHLDHEMNRHQANGFSPGEARRLATIELGGLDQVKEQCRDQRGIESVESFLRDLHLATKRIGRSPGFFGSAVLLIALGVAVNSQIFSLINAVVLRPLPVRDPGSLVQLFTIHSGLLPYPYFEDGFLREIQAHSSTLTGVIGQIEMTVPLDRNGTVERVHAQRVTGDYFRVLGVSPALGRTLNEHDDRVALLSHAYWRRSFGGDPNILGRTVRLYARPFIIVGVAPESFTGTVIDSSSDLWIPLESTYNFHDDPAVQVNQAYIDEAVMEIVARLRPGTTLAQAQAEVSLRRNRYSQERNRAQKALWEVGVVEVRSIARGTSPLRDQAATILWLLLAGAVLLLLMVSANVGSLLLARVSARAQETAIMLAVGARSSRIARLWAMESLLLSIAGGIFGACIAWQTLPLWVRWLPPARGIGIDTSEIRTRALDLHPDIRIAGFGIAICTLAALLSSLAPAWRSSRSDLWSALKIAIGDRRHRRFQAGLCAVQVALCTVLLVFSALMLRTLSNLEAANTGIDRNHIAFFRMDPLAARYNKQQTESLQWRLVDGARALPGVEAAAIAIRPLMRGIGLVNSVIFPGQPPGAPWNTSTNTVSPEYFETMGMRFAAGRGFYRREPGTGRPQPAVVNQAFVNRFLNGRNAVDQVFATGTKWMAPEFQIVGVVNDTKYRSLREMPPPIFYTSDFAPGREINSFVLYVRTQGEPAALIPAVRKLLTSLDPGVSFYEVGTLDGDIDRSLWQERMLVALGTAFGVFAIMLGAIGLYGILAYFVTGRRREIGLRMALGATPVNIGGVLLKQLIPTVGIGLAGGAAMSLAAGTLARSVLYGVGFADLRSLASASVVIVLMASGAMAVPIWRALRLDPASTLREE